MKLLAELRAQGRGQDMAAVVASIPYARFLGIEVDRKGNEITTIMPFKEHLSATSTCPPSTAAPSARSWRLPR
jgi:hypothetical protein